MTDVCRYAPTVAWAAPLNMIKAKKTPGEGTKKVLRVRRKLSPVSQMIETSVCRDGFVCQIVSLIHTEIQAAHLFRRCSSMGEE